MYEKIKNWTTELFELRKLWKVGMVFGIIALIISIFVLTVTNKWGDFRNYMFDYPEEAYESLETEAYKIIETKNFDTEYRLIINQYDSESNYLSIKLVDGSISVTATVDNYGEDNQEIIVKRLDSTPIQQIARNIFLLILTWLEVSVIGILAVMILSLIVLLIAFITHRIVRVEDEEEESDHEESEQEESDQSEAD